MDFKKVKYWWRFHLEKRDRRDFRVFISATITIICCIPVLEYTTVKHKTDFTQFKHETDAFFSSAEKARHNAKNEAIHHIYSPKNTPLIELNTANVSNLESISGIGPVYAARIIKYRNLLGGYHTKEQLLKVYGIDTALYNQIEQYISVDASLHHPRTPTRPLYKPKTTAKPVSDNVIAKPISNQINIELNSADTFDIKFITGIGTVYASRIVKYRDLLGGYHKKEQLLEVYGIDTALYHQIEPYIQIDTTLIKRININKAGSHTLGSHPYISRRVASAVVNYREQHGPYADIEDVRKIVLINNDLFFKIKPYLTIF